MTDHDESTYIHPETLLAEIQRVSREGATREEAQKLFDMIVADHKNRTRLIVLGTLQERVNQFLNQAEMVREIDRRLYDEERLKRASNLELISLRKTVVHDMYKMLEIILPKLGPLLGEPEPAQGLLSGHLHLHMHGKKNGGAGEEEEALSRSQAEGVVQFFAAFDRHLRGRQVAEIPPPVEKPKVKPKKKSKKKSKKSG